MFTKSWKVYGTEGHRQKKSFYPSIRYDFSVDGVPRIIEILCSDRTGTNDYVIVTITRATPEECDLELLGQISDGFFENCRCHKFEEITA